MQSHLNTNEGRLLAEATFRCVLAWDILYTAKGSFTEICCEKKQNAAPNLR